MSVPRLTVHDRGDTWADVTEGTRAGPVVNWERCRYDWSQPGSVTAPVTDSNVYAFPASSWEIKATPTENGSNVEMIWVREFKPGLRGRLFGTLFRTVGEAAVHRIRPRRTDEPRADRAERGARRASRRCVQPPEWSRASTPPDREEPGDSGIDKYGLETT